jgi:hypothetical protein
MLKLIKEFLAAVSGAKKGLLVPEELFRSVVTALGSGSALGLVLMVLQTVVTNVALIFPNPIVASLATMSLSLVIDLVRRLGHGAAPVPPSNPNVIPPAPTV